MSNSSWMIRTEECDPSEVYDVYSTLITVRINHGGFSGRRYINGKHDFVDLVNIDELSVHDFNAMMKELRYNDKERMYYHFLIPNCELDFGLHVFGSDQDILNLLNYAPKIKLIDVFIEHGKTSSSTYLASPNPSNDGSETNLQHGGDDKDDDTEESDYLVNEGNRLDKLDVDMGDYIDSNAECMGVHEEATDTESDNVDGDVDPFDVDQFSNGEDNDVVGSCKKSKSDRTSHGHIQFYLGQTFGCKETIRNLIKQHALKSRRDIVVVKNDKQRIRVVCRGTLHKLSDASGPSDPSRLGKRRNAKWVKTEETCPWVLYIPTTLVPPKHHKQIGRPKKKRKKAGEESSQISGKTGKFPRGGKSMTCDKCKNPGHNSRTCKGQGT